MAYVINVILLCVFFGLCCSYLAEKQGRPRMFWFLMGFICPLVAAALLFFLPPPKKNRPLPKKPAPRKLSEHEMKSWFYIDAAHQSYGPIDFILLNRSWKNKEIDEHSYIWAEGMKDWSKIKELPDLHKELTKKVKE